MNMNERGTCFLLMLWHSFSWKYMFLKMWKMLWHGTQDESWFIALTCVDFILDILMLCHGENHLNQTEKYAWQDRKDELIPRSVLTGWAKKTARGISHFDLFPQFSPLRSLLSVSPARHLATLARAEHCGVRMNFCNYRNGGETTNCWNNFVLTSRSASQTKLFQTYPNIKETRWMYPYH